MTGWAVIAIVLGGIIVWDTFWPVENEIELKDE